MVTKIAEARIAIVGLGLMGGSLAAALSAHAGCRHVVGVARRSSTVSTAEALRFVERGYTDLAEGVRDADLVVLATPVRDILAKIGSIGPLLKPGCVVMDVGSTKTAICSAMESMPSHVQPLGGHPMCGKETSGLEMADPRLFRDRVFVLCPMERTGSQALDLGQALVEAIGARPMLLDPERHDRLVATTSHLPYLLAVALMRAADRRASEDPLVWRLAASGFRDTSRLAGGDTTMMLDILLTNKGPLLEALLAAQGELSALAGWLGDQDSAALKSALESARNRRAEEIVA